MRVKLNNWGNDRMELGTWTCTDRTLLGVRGELGLERTRMLPGRLPPKKWRVCGTACGTLGCAKCALRGRKSAPAAASPIGPSSHGAIITRPHPLAPLSSSVPHNFLFYPPTPLVSSSLRIVVYNSSNWTTC